MIMMVGFELRNMNVLSVWQPSMCSERCADSLGSLDSSFEEVLTETSPPMKTNPRHVDVFFIITLLNVLQWSELN